MFPPVDFEQGLNFLDRIGIETQLGTFVILSIYMDKKARTRVDLVENLMKLIGSKWKPAIIYCLVHSGKLRFGELRQAIPDITQRMLTMRLRELERDGFVKRTFHEAIPPRVEYEMTKLGMEIHPFFRDLCLWGESREKELAAARERFERSQSR